MAESPNSHGSGRAKAVLLKIGYSFKIEP